MSAICGDHDASQVHHSAKCRERECVSSFAKKQSIIAATCRYLDGNCLWLFDLMNVLRLLRLWFREWRVMFEQLWKTNKIMQNCAVCVWLWLIGIISETAQLICLHVSESRERGCDIIFAIIALMRHHNDHYVFTATSNFNGSPKYIECGAGVVLAAVHLLMIYIKPRWTRWKYQM